MPTCKFKKNSTDSSLGLLPPANEVWGKVMFLYLSFCSRGVCIQVGEGADGVGQIPPSTMGYGQQVGSTYPTGMHSCSHLGSMSTCWSGLIADILFKLAACNFW